MNARRSTNRQTGIINSHHNHRQPIQTNSILCERWPINYQSCANARQSIISLTVESALLNNIATSKKPIPFTVVVSPAVGPIATADPVQATTTLQIMAKGNMKSNNKHQYELDRLYHNVKASGGRDHCHDLYKRYHRELNAYKKKGPKPSCDLQRTSALYRSMKEKEVWMKMEEMVTLTTFGKRNLS